MPSERGDHKACVVVGVAISEARWRSLEAEFVSFVSGLSRAELAQGEPKGNLLLRKSLLRFCEILASQPGVTVAPVTLDMTHLVGEPESAIAESMERSLRDRLPEFVHDSMRAEIELLANRSRNAGDVVMRRLYSWAYCFHQSVQHALFILGEEHEVGWASPTFTIDAVAIRPESRERLVFESMVKAWVSAWFGQDRPLLLVRQFHPDSHPFNQSYSTADGMFDVGKLFCDRIVWGQSSCSWGLQVADIAATIVHRAANDPRNDNNWMPVYRELMRSSFYGPVRGPGLFTPSTRGLLSSVVARYSLLSQFMDRDREGYILINGRKLWVRR